MSNPTDKAIFFEIPGTGEISSVTELTVNAGDTIDLAFKVTNVTQLSISFRLSADEDEYPTEIAISESDWGDVIMEPINTSVKWKGIGEVVITPPDQQKEFHFKIKGFTVSDLAGTAEILAFESGVQLLPSLKIHKIKDDTPFIQFFEADKYFANKNTPVVLHWKAKNVTKFRLYGKREIALSNAASEFYKIENLTESGNYTLEGINESNKKQVTKDIYLTAYENTKISVAEGQFPLRARILGLYPDTNKNELYALVQHERENVATLYKATSNVLQRWKEEYAQTGTQSDEENTIQPATFPLELAMRPGLIFGDKLWLIGGSTYDPDVPSNMYGYIDLRTKKWVDKGMIVYSGQPMLPRMGHACVVHDQKLWVIGGHNPDRIHALADIWAYDGSNWEKVNHELPSGRCMMAACNRIFNKVEHPLDKTKNKQDEQLWIFGGYEDIPGGKRSFNFYCMNKKGRFELIEATMRGNQHIEDYDAVSMMANEDGAMYVLANDVYHLYFDDKWILKLRLNGIDWPYNVKGHYLQTATFLKSIWINSVHFPKGDVFEKKRGHLFYGYFVE
jgi:hypothetical protein